MPRRIDPDTQIPTRQQAAILLLASQTGGTNQGEFVRLSGKDSMGANFALRAMLRSTWRRPNMGIVDGKWQQRGIICRHGRGWLTRRVVKKRKGGNFWKYKITPKGKLALQRYFEPLPEAPAVVNLQVAVQDLADHARGWANIAGWKLEDCVLAAMALFDLNVAAGWEGVLRARDLRFPGWGPLHNLAATVVNLCNGNSKLPRRLPRVGQVQVGAYGYEYGMDLLIQRQFPPEWLAWLARYKDWWLGDSANGRVGNLNRLDEVGHCIRYNGQPDAPPDILFARVAQQYNDPEMLESDEESKELAKPFAAVPAEVETPVGKLITVTSDQELREVGKKLHNCVGRYGLTCRREGRLIAVLTNDAGKPLACGEWIKGKWGQISGPCNKEPDMVIMVAFQQHGKELAKLAFQPKLEGKTNADVPV